MRVLLIDNYDSYTYNLAQLMGQVYGRLPTVAPNDADALTGFDPAGFDAIVVSPGPGRPEQAHDLEALAADTDDMHRWSAVDLPVLLMQGADTWDPMPATMDRLAAVLPAVARVRWTGQSHFATSTDPALVAGTLRRFWSGEAPCGSC